MSFIHGGLVVDVEQFAVLVELQFKFVAEFDVISLTFLVDLGDELFAKTQIFHIPV